VSVGVVESTTSVFGIYYTQYSQIKHKLSSVDNYISQPNHLVTGGVHLIYRYYSDKAASIYNDLKIELQIRSQYQHAWATAVETVGTFVRESLKSSMGSEDWLRFFALMGSAIAQREGTAIVPGTPNDSNDLLKELRRYSEELRVVHRLRAYGDALQRIEGDTQSAFYYLLELDSTEEHPRLTITGFPQSKFEEAAQRYSEAEKRVKANPRNDAVLVSVDSLSALPRAYPNYFADTRVFVELLTQAMTGRKHRINPKALRLV
jgi:hypothetical protein